MTAKPLAGRVLVTGGAGFIGSHLADRLLRDGWYVTVLDDLSTGNFRNIRHVADEANFRFVQGSVLDAPLVSRLVDGSDHVYHLAAAVGVKLIVDKPLQSLITNIRGTETVLEAVDRRRRKILLTSTSEIYGKSSNGPFREDQDRVLGSPQKLRWSYSTSKAVDEILAHVYHRERGLPTVVARLFNTVGPRQSDQYGMVLPRFVGQALAGKPLTVFGDGSQSRAFTYVGDVVEALTRLMSTPAAEGGVFNVVSDQEITIKDLALRVVARTESHSTLEFIPYEQAYGQDDFEDLARRSGDATRLAQVTGFRCTTTLDESIDRLIEYSRQSNEAA